MYFVTGGRGTRSAFYRVAYTGDDASEPSANPQQTARQQHAQQARRTRRSLEAFLGRRDPRAVDAAWPHLKSSDPWIRHAARAVVESQPVASWQPRALIEPQTNAALAALLALEHVRLAEDRGKILERLNHFDLTAFTERQKLEALFLYDRCLPEDAGESASQRAAVLKQLDPLYPDISPSVNQRLGLLLSRLSAPDFVPRTVKLLEQTEDQTQRMQCLFVLRNEKEGWTPELREAYFQQLARMSEFIGGEGMPTFRRLIETDALNTVAEEERARYSKLLLGNLLGSVLADAPQETRPFVRKWTLDDFPEPLGDLQTGRDLQRGKRMFAAARCVACHRAEGQGGVSGPDLTSVARRFTPRDILTSILEPSRVVAENYQNDAFQLRDGRVVVGRIVPGDYRSPELTVMPDLLAPETTVTVSKSDIESHQPSPTSPMPTGLVDTLSREEILDLLAYLVSSRDG
jgi:putative heme-binding domain-containing protein